MPNRDNVKPWFETGDYPTQTQFWQLFDWLFFKDESIGQGNVTGLVEALAGKADTGIVQALQERIIPSIFLYPAASIFAVIDGLIIDKIVIIPDAADTIIAGLANATDDVIPETQLIAGAPNLFSIEPGVYGAGGTTIYFTGFTQNASIIIFKR